MSKPLEEGWRRSAQTRPSEGGGKLFQPSDIQIPPPKYERFSDELLTPRTISQVLSALVAAWNQEIETNKRDRAEITGIPRHSIIHRVQFDYQPCARELRRLLRCAETHIDITLCTSLRSDWLYCRNGIP